MVQTANSNARASLSESGRRGRLLWATPADTQFHVFRRYHTSPMLQVWTQKAVAYSNGTVQQQYC